MHKHIRNIIAKVSGRKWTEAALSDAIEALDEGDALKAHFTLRMALSHANTEAPEAIPHILRAMNYSAAVIERSPS
jgi:hypothetical protein